LGVFGEPRVNVLELNLALAKEFPGNGSPRHARLPGAQEKVAK
jgi:hypothetical protein